MSDRLSASFSYPEYRALIAALRADNRTTGANHSEAFLHYTDLNLHRMDKWDKRYAPGAALVEKMKNLAQAQDWLIITEAWCGDAAHSVPMLAQIAALAPDRVKLQIVLRDDNLDLMDRYLTNGGRSIPKLIARDRDGGQDIFQWGPRPAALQDLRQQWLADNWDKEAINIALQKWYARDRGAALEQELLALLP